MLKRFLPKEHSFFDLFQQSADKLVLTATEFHALLLNLPNLQQHVDAIANFEKEADTITRFTFELLHKTFITPFDRHDIHQLNSKMDDVLDLINHCAQRFPFYGLKSVPSELIELSSFAMEATMLIKDAVYRLHNLAQSADILKSCEDIELVENNADQILLAGEKKIFDNESDPKQFFILKEIYTRTKDVIDKCQDVANIIKAIVLEYS